VAVMLGALLIHNVVPSPTFISEEPVLVYGIFVAFFLAHFVMILLQAVGMRVFLKVAHLPKYVLASTVLFFCATGVFALHNIIFDIWTLFWFGILGYLMKKFGFPLAPMILGVILGDLAEVNMNRAYMSDPDPTLFFTRPISLFFVVLAIVSLVFPFWQQNRHLAWADYFPPVSLLAVSIPFWISPGNLKFGGLIFAAAGIYLICRQIQANSVTA
jgi:putative tricarboxylic transport membrane protein